METVTTANKAIIRRLFDEALNQGRLELVDELFSADFVDHSTPEQRPGPEGVRDFFIAVRSRFPDIKVTIEDIIAEGNRVVVRTLWQRSVGTRFSASDVPQSASDAVGTRFSASAQDSNPLNGTLIQIFHLENGRIVEEWNEGSGPGEA